MGVLWLYHFTYKNVKVFLYFSVTDGTGCTCQRVCGNFMYVCMTVSRVDWACVIEENNLKLQNFNILLLLLKFFFSFRRFERAAKWRRQRTKKKKRIVKKEPMSKKKKPDRPSDRISWYFFDVFYWCCCFYVTCSSPKSYG